MLGLTLLPRRWLLQTLLFYAILILIILRSLRPVDTQRLFLFMPLVLVYGFLLRALSGRRGSSRSGTLPSHEAVEHASQA